MIKDLRLPIPADMFSAFETHTPAPGVLVTSDYRFTDDAIHAWLNDYRDDAWVATDNQASTFMGFLSAHIKFADEAAAMMFWLRFGDEFLAARREMDERKRRMETSKAAQFAAMANLARQFKATTTEPTIRGRLRNFWRAIRARLKGVVA